MQTTCSDASGSRTGRRVLVAGATGLVGQFILRELLQDEKVLAVHALGRRAPSVQHPKLKVHLVDFRALPALPAVDEVYLALGTTIRAAGSQQAFRAVDFDANLAVARAALQVGARRAGLVSAMGANAQSRIFYNRVKGELEQALMALPFEALVLARPSLLAGERASLGQAPRAGEGIGLRLASLIGPLLPADLRPIPAQAVARALVARVPLAQGVETMSSGQLQAWRNAPAPRS